MISQQVMRPIKWYLASSMPPHYPHYHHQHPTHHHQQQQHHQHNYYYCILLYYHHYHPQHHPHHHHHQHHHQHHDNKVMFLIIVSCINLHPPLEKKSCENWSAASGALSEPGSPPKTGTSSPPKWQVEYGKSWWTHKNQWNSKGSSMIFQVSKLFGILQCLQVAAEHPRKTLGHWGQ